MANKPVSLVIHKVRLTRKNVIIEYHNGNAALSCEDPENPLPEFKAAIAALVPLLMSVCHFPADYSEGLIACGVTVTDKGQFTVQGKKSFDDAAGPLNISTPLRIREEEEGGKLPGLTAEQDALIDEVLEQAKRYILGERAQGVLFNDEDPGDDDPTGGDEPELLPSEKDKDPPANEIAAVPKKPRKPRKPKVPAAE